MISNNEGRVPTTDEMDEITEPGERWKLAYMCGDCAEWVFFTVKPENRHQISTTKGEKCPHCGGQKVAPRSIISQRTWDAERAKKETSAYKRKLKK